MFTRLKNRFLILNLVIISVMMLLAFTSIYLITHSMVNKDIAQGLRRVAEFSRKVNEIPNQRQLEFNRPLPPPDRSVSFSINTDGEGNISGIFSLFEMEDEFYKAAKSLVLSMERDTGKFKLDGTYWTFLISPNDLDGNKIVFLDITSQQAILTNLIYTFFIVALLMFIVIFFISRFFANRAIEPIKDAFCKQKQFIADASHELKTPLAVINTNVDVLLSNEDGNLGSLTKWLSYIKLEVERMTKLTNDLLYLTHIDYSEIKMIFNNLNISDIVENVILALEAVFYENEISVNYHVEPNLVIYGNCEHLQQVIMILLDNAVKYTDSKGMVDISLKKLQNSILLSVTNTGSGITEEHINRIFDRFYRADKSRTRKNGGYGLGLSIAKTIIEQHNGKISVTSILNKSTNFSVELPRT